MSVQNGEHNVTQWDLTTTRPKLLMQSGIIFLIWVVNVLLFINTFMKSTLLLTSLAINEPAAFAELGSPSGLTSASSAKLITYCFAKDAEKLHPDVKSASYSLKRSFQLQLCALMAFFIIIFAAGT